mgnify:CR=1 FL=1
MKYCLQIYKGQSLSGIGQIYETIKLPKLKHIPRIGEEVRYKFTCYNVVDIFHDFDEKTISILVE